MREYLLRRLLLLIPTLLGVTFIVFLMMHFIPGDPVTNMMGEAYSAEDVEQLYWVNDTGYPFYQAHTDKVKGYPFYNQVYLCPETTWLDT